MNKLMFYNVVTTLLGAMEYRNKFNHKNTIKILTLVRDRHAKILG